MKSNNKKYKTLKMRINVDEEIDKLLFQYKHLENMILIAFKKHDDFNFLNKSFMRPALFKTKGGKKEEEVNVFKEKYKETLEPMQKVCEQLNSHNIATLLERLNGDFKKHLTNLKQGIKSNFIQPKRLSKINRWSLPLDSGKWTLKEKDKKKKQKTIGINLGKKMKYFYINIKNISRIIFNEKNIQAVNFSYENGEYWVNISYLYQEFDINKLSLLYNAVTGEFNNSVRKNAGCDVGINNLLSIFVEDIETKSIIYDGKPIKYKNYQFNKNNDDFQKELSKHTTLVELYPHKYYPEYDEIGVLINQKRKQNLANRSNYYYSEFHAISKRVVEFLLKANVSDFYISKNLSFLKNTRKEDKETFKQRKSTKQQFYQIPFGKLLSLIEEKCNEVGIRVHVIDEAYTSKESVFSDVVGAQEQGFANVSNGKRAKRGLYTNNIERQKRFKKKSKKYKEHKKNMKKMGFFEWNCDISAGANHIKVGTDNRTNYNWLLKYKHKICNPVKIKSNYEFCKILSC
jgi:IS605 OrfB family transposase